VTVKFKGIAKKITSSLTLLLLSFSLAFAAEEQDRMKHAGDVMKEILDNPHSLPLALLDKAQCLVVLPSVRKGGFGVGGTYGRGVLVCRNGPRFTGPWGSPAFYALEGHGVKFPGGHDTDFILLVLSPKAARSLLSGKVKIGSDVSDASGPNGPVAENFSAPADAEILSYTRDNGSFAGISLHGCTLRSDTNADQKLYRKKLTAKEIIEGHKVEVPSSARQLIALLNSKSPSMN
jgi:lipid-binding SYLF domain-containing protein